jgi:glycine/D-amino acid oxidase-like deaminating enzyme
MQRYLAFGFVALLVVVQQALASNTDDEQTLWRLEHAYWLYVEKNDLVAYANLWHQDFVGWPSVSSTPVRKDHITDWIPSQTSKGLTFKQGEFEAHSVQEAREIAADDARRIHPLLDLSDHPVIGWEPGAGYADAYLALSAFARAARRRGVTIREGVAVTGLIREGTRITGVATAQGPIAAGFVVAYSRASVTISSTSSPQIGAAHCGGKRCTWVAAASTTGRSEVG